MWTPEKTTAIVEASGDPNIYTNKLNKSQLGITNTDFFLFLENYNKRGRI